jgi:hypothetical protein
MKQQNNVDIAIRYPKEQLSPEEEKELGDRVKSALVLFVPELEKMGEITVKFPRTKTP